MKAKQNEALNPKHPERKTQPSETSMFRQTTSKNAPTSRRRLLNSAVIVLSALAFAMPFNARADDPCIGDPHWDTFIFQSLIDSPPSASGVIWALGVHDEHLYIGRAANPPITQWNGITWQDLPPLSQLLPRAIGSYGGDLIVGGSSSATSGLASERIVRWNAATTAWQSLGGGVSFTVLAVTEWEGDLIVGGGFLSAGGQTVNRIARWDGSSWHPFVDSDTGITGMSGPVVALAVWNGDLIAAGDFLSAGGKTVNRIAKWDADGSRWVPLGGGVNSFINALTVYDGDLIAGGWFTQAGGAAICWCDEDCCAFGDCCPDKEAACGGCAPAATVPAGSCFGNCGDSVGGGIVNANRIARWDGAAWHPLAGGMNDEVRTLAAYGNDLYAGGHFTTAGGTTANFIARWNGSGWHNIDLTNTQGITHHVAALTEYREGLATGGVFHHSPPQGGIVTNLMEWRLCLRDTDGDGIPDDWEINGIPYTAIDGTEKRYLLPEADPMRKNLWVEVDAMLGFSMSDEVLHGTAPCVLGGSADETKGNCGIVFAFANAPVSNPDGSTGIILHVQRDETDLFPVDYWETQPANHCWPVDFDLYRSAYFGTQEERDSPDAEAMLEAKAKAFRYVIVANKATPKNLHGCGLVRGDNSVLFFGAATSETTRAALFMHELGHNLGLRHGGGDTANGKPNYPSIMNYVLTYPQHWSEEFWRLDYSRAGAGEEGLLDLNESCLNETIGIGAADGFYADFYMPFGIWIEFSDRPGEVEFIRSIYHVKLDGSPVDFGDERGTGFQDDEFTTCAVQDLNYLIDPPPGIELPSEPSPGDTLAAHNDWVTVAANLPTRAMLGPAAGPLEIPDDQLTVETVEWMNENFPIPPRPKRPDIPVPPCDQWSDLAAGVDGGLSPNVRALAVYNGELIAGGSFITAGGATVNNIARWDGLSWQPLASGGQVGVNGVVRAMIVHKGELIVGGQFTTAGGQTVNRIARWDGSSWQPFVADGVVGMNDGPVFALAVYNGDLIVGGNFWYIGDFRTKNLFMNIARWDGSEWHPFSVNGNVGTNDEIYSLTDYDGDLVAGGFFSSAGGVSVSRIARWDGSTWHPFVSGGQTGVGCCDVNALWVYNGDLIAAGGFSTAGGMSVNAIARWDGIEWHSLDGGVSGTVLALNEYNGDLIVGGDYFDAGDIFANRIARWDGSQWHAFVVDGNVGIPGGVAALAVQDDVLVAGGFFNSAGGSPVNKIARWRDCAPHSPRCPADLTGSGVVNVFDLLELLGSWGPCPAPPAVCPADLTGGGIVNVFDLLELLAAWGPCP